MDVRKIIAFGKSSFVVSLPKKWLDRYHLKKGDVLFVNQEGDKLIIAPEEKEEVREETRRIIQTDKKSLKRLRREISSAFINHTDYIILEGKTLPTHAAKLVEIIHDLIALEIVEQSHNRIVARDFLRVGDVRVSEYLRKADIVVRSILADLKNPSYDDFDDILLRQEGVTRIHLLILKVLKAIHTNPTAYRKLEIDGDMVLSYTRFNFGLQNISLALREISKIMKTMKGKELASTRSVVGALEADYLELMKAHISQNIERALDFSERRDVALEIIETDFKKDGAVRYIIMSNAAYIHREMHEMAHRIIA